MKVVNKAERKTAKKLEYKKEECQKEITAFRRDINDILDNLEKDIQENLDTVANQQLKAIDKQIAALEASLLALDADLEAIDNTFKTNKEEIMFSANVKVSKTVSEYEKLVQDIKNGMQEPKLEFQTNKKLTDMFKSVESFGILQQSELHSAQQDNTVILDMMVKSKEEVAIRLSGDDLEPDINGCAFLSNGQILICDYNNKKVKLIDSDLSVKESLKLSEEPYNVAAVGENEAVITFYSSSYTIQYINTHPHLKLGKKIKLPDKCFGLHVVNDEIYTTCHKGSGRDEVWRLNKAGNIVSTAVLTQNSSARSDYLGLSLAGSSPRVYLTDTNNSRVTCFQLEPTMVYQYQDHEQLREADDIYVDSAGNSLVCGARSNNVIVITADGMKHGELLTHNDITYPKCIDYRPADKSLIVGGLQLFMYKLGK